MKNLLSVSDLTESQIKKLILVAKEIKTEKEVSSEALKTNLWLYYLKSHLSEHELALNLE